MYHGEWGGLIVFYLFLGGLSAGTLVLSSLATIAGRGRLGRVACYGALAAPWPVLIGTGLLVLDLGQPLFFWKLLLAFRPKSPMWVGTWLLALFVMISIPYAALFLPRQLRRWDPPDRQRWQRRLGAIALPVGIGVGLYTGVLLSVLVARPLWNTPLLSQLFLVSALSTATALLVSLLRGASAATERHLLIRADLVLIAIELLLIASMFLAGRTSLASASAALEALSRGALGVAFWIGVVACGLVLPLLIDSAALQRAAPRGLHGWGARLEPVAALLVLAGGFALRWIFVAAGQATALVGAP